MVVLLALARVHRRGDQGEQTHGTAAIPVTDTIFAEQSWMHAGCA